MDYSVSLGELIVSGAVAVLAWEAGRVVRLVEKLAVRMTHLEAWAAQRGFEPVIK